MWINLVSNASIKGGRKISRDHKVSAPRGTIWRGLHAWFVKLKCSVGIFKRKEKADQ